FDFLFFSYYVVLHVLLSFPTRRSSDLLKGILRLHLHHHLTLSEQDSRRARNRNSRTTNRVIYRQQRHRSIVPFRTASRTKGNYRSEEHTSELQSQSNLVCRLLLEKKKI